MGLTEVIIKVLWIHHFFKNGGGILTLKLSSGVPVYVGLLWNVAALLMYSIMSFGLICLWTLVRLSSADKYVMHNSNYLFMMIGSIFGGIYLLSVLTLHEFGHYWFMRSKNIPIKRIELGIGGQWRVLSQIPFDKLPPSQVVFIASGGPAVQALLSLFGTIAVITIFGTPILLTAFIFLLYTLGTCFSDLHLFIYYAIAMVRRKNFCRLRH